MSEKPTKCSICRHRELAAIDLALARGVSVGALARRYVVGADSLYRHARAHLPAQLRASLIAGPSIEGLDLDKLRETESQSLLMNLVALRHRLFASLDTAEEAGDGNMLSRVAGQLHKNMELVGRLLGDLNTGSTITNILIQPQYVEMRIGLVDALRPFPEAARAVALVLHQIEAKAADAVRAETRELAQGSKVVEMVPEFVS
jgi:transposase-like protein